MGAARALSFSLTERVALLEDACQLHSTRMDNLQQEIKMILKEVNFISNWIHQHFDVDSLNRNSLTHSDNNYSSGDVDDSIPPQSLRLTAEEQAKGSHESSKEVDITNECKISEFQEVEIIQIVMDDIAVSKSRSCEGKLGNNIIEPSAPHKNTDIGNETTKKSKNLTKEDITGKNLLKCEECGKVLKGSGSLRAHMRTHSNLRPHQCTICNKSFRMKHHLEFHLLVHSGDKKESCCFCGKSFLVKRDLLRHERTHTGERPFACPHCPKSFNVKQHLTLHIRTHTGERPYKCDICEKTFTQANSLRIHKKIHLKESIVERILDKHKMGKQN